MVYQFHPPLPARAKADTLVISTRQIGQSTAYTPTKGMLPPGVDAIPGPAEAGVFSVYNWQTATWDPLPGGTEEVRLSPASPYVTSDGIVRLQVSADQGEVVTFLQPELTVEGTVME